MKEDASKGRVHTKNQKFGQNLEKCQSMNSGESGKCRCEARKYNGTSKALKSNCWCQCKLVFVEKGQLFNTVTRFLAEIESVKHQCNINLSRSFLSKV